VPPIPAAGTASAMRRAARPEDLPGSQWYPGHPARAQSIASHREPRCLQRVPCSQWRCRARPTHRAQRAHRSRPERRERRPDTAPLTFDSRDARPQSKVEVGRGLHPWCPGEQAEERACLRSIGTAGAALIQVGLQVACKWACKWPAVRLALPARPCGPAPVSICVRVFSHVVILVISRLEVISQFLFQKIARTVDARFDRPV
jgi:hypothetical protein